MGELKEKLQQVLEESKRRFSPYNQLSDQLVHLPLNRSIYVFALGKAAYQMMEAVLYHADQEEMIRIREGLVITRYGNVKGPLPNVTILEASHINPDENSLKAGDAAIEFLSRLDPDAILLVLLSGGGSALMEKPVPGLSLAEFNEKIKTLAQNGASPEELDAERKRYSEVKGGKLLQYVKCRDIYIYAMSEITGDYPKYIASNPFLPDAETVAEKLDPDNFHRFDNLTSERFISRDQAITYKIIANNSAFCRIIKEVALDLLPDLHADYVHLITTELTGDAAKCGQDIADMANLVESKRDKGQAVFRVPCMMIFGGLPRQSLASAGKGGSCTEIALAAVEGLSNLQDCALLTYATDGLDGLPVSAGAVIDNNTLQDLIEHDINIGKSLEENDSYRVFKSIGAILPGEYTGINVNNIVLLYIR